MLITIVFPNTYSLSTFSCNQPNFNSLSQFIASLLVTFVHPNLYPNLFSLKVVVAPVDHPAQFVAVPVPDMSISVHCRSRRDLEIRDLVRFSRCFLGKSTITVLRFKLQYTKNINLDQISVIFPRLYTENPGLELYFPKSREIFPKFPSRDLNLNPIHDLNHDLV